MNSKKVESLAQEVNSLSDAELAQLARFLTLGTLRILTNDHSSGGYTSERSGGKIDSKGKSKHPNSVIDPPPLDRAQELQPFIQETGAQVAFQSCYGTPWRLIGPNSSTFTWSSADKGKVTDENKQQIRRHLQSYANDQDIGLHGEASVRLALRRGQYWVSFAGGVSTIQT